VPKQKLNIME